ncbi:MAG: phosphatase PAP2 family protein [Bacteroidetes bacterium]|nr:MAG: phosphatase PAP2 family protein [Bacteroidota bacterium]
MESTLLKRVFSGLSVILHPVFLFMYIFFFLLYKTDVFWGYFQAFNIKLITGYLFVNTILIPILITYLVNKDFQLNNKALRTVPLFVFIVVYVITFFLLTRILAPAILLRYVAAVILLGILLLVLNSFMKVSLHSAGWGLTLAFFLYLFFKNNDQSVYFYAIIGCLMLAGLAGTARLYLKAHNPTEIFTGYLTGILSMIVILFV